MKILPFLPSVLLNLQSRLSQDSIPRDGIHESITDCIGNTPIVRISEKMGVPEGVNLFVKLESENPGGKLGKIDCCCSCIMN